MRPPPFRDRHLSRLRLLPSLSQQFFPVLSQPSFSFSSTERRKAIATVWLPSSPSPGANDAPGPRSSPRAQRAAHSAQLRLSISPREDARARCPRDTRAAAPAPPATAPSRAGPRRVASKQAGAPGRAHARGAPGRAGHTPPTLSESLSLPALAHLRPGSVSLSLSLPESLCFPLRTHSTAVAQALRRGGDREGLT